MSSSISRSLLKLVSIESKLPSNHLTLCCPLLLLPSVFPSIWVFLLGAHSPAGGPSGACHRMRLDIHGLVGTPAVCWAPSVSAAVSFSRRRHRLGEVSGENQCCNGSFPAPKAALFPALGKFPQHRAACRSFSYAASPGAATQMALR